MRFNDSIMQNRFVLGATLICFCTLDRVIF